MVIHNRSRINRLCKSLNGYEAASSCTISTTQTVCAQPVTEAFQSSTGLEVSVTFFTVCAHIFIFMMHICARL